MSKYILVFRSYKAFDWTTLPKEEAQKAQSAWAGWIASMGSAVQSSEAFKFGGKSVTKDGNKEADNLLVCYIVVEAENFSEAEKLAEGAPGVTLGQGSMEVYEILPTRH